MNVSFTIPKDHALEPVFVEEALKEGMLGLKGHRHLGGIRASIYNAVSQSDVDKLGEFMREFAIGLKRQHKSLQQPKLRHICLKTSL